MLRRPLALWLCASLILACSGRAVAQQNAISLAIAPDAVGLAGVVRPGSWTPMRVTVDNHSADNRAVICQWLVKDHDGDTVDSRRTLTVNPQRRQQLWLYADLRLHLAQQWTVQLLDAETHQILDTAQVAPRQTLSSGTTVMGLCASSDLGLKAYTNQAASHQKLALIAGLSLNDLPDRWYGLNCLQALIWTRQGGDPNSTPSPRILHAIRQWVMRGGQLIISLPAINRPWAASPLADMLPVDPSQYARVHQVPPTCLGPTRGQPVKAIPMTVFDLTPSGGSGAAAGRAHVAVLARDDQQRPLIIAKRFGFGRVTLIGVDLTNPALRHLGLPFGKYRIWNRIFNWQSPAFSNQTLAGEIQAGQISRPSSRPAIALDHFIPALITMRHTAAPALLAAIALFVVYWLIAGPVGFSVLKRRKRLHFAWLGFLCVVVVFTVIAWGGAYLLKPATARIRHFTLLQADADSPVVHVHSVLSLFVPRFGEAEVAIDPDQPDAPNTLASPGLIPTLSQSSFLSPRTYRIDAADPSHADLPMRATAKQLVVDYLGRLDTNKSASDPWNFPTGQIHLQNFWPVGELTHNLPGTLTNVVVIYCPGSGETPWVWLAGPWAPHQVLNLADHGGAQRLVRRPDHYSKHRQWQREGFLGQLIGLKTGVQSALNPLDSRPADNEIAQAIEMLSFYSTLPPPNFRDTGFSGPPTTYVRSLGRCFDMTALTDAPCVIILGELDDSPLPLPLTVDHHHPEARGRTIVQWIDPL